MPDTPELPLRLISQPDELAAAARRWAAAPAIALDTEFVRERTFFQRLGLIQVCDGSAVDLVDPLAVPELGPLTAVLRDPAVLKVVHSASEDIEISFHRLGVLPAPLFDTQIAASLAGMAPPPGYAKLIGELLGIPLAKGETRTDWLARPLSHAQLVYAADDVRYLLPAFEILGQRLRELGRFDWALEDSAALLDPARFTEAAGQAYLRLKAVSQLTRRQLAAARALAAWREDEARRRDVPRGFVLRDDLLTSLARRAPKDLPDLQARPAYDPRSGPRYAADWLELLAGAAALPDAELPASLATAPLSAAAKQREEQLRDAVRARAAELGIAPEILAPKRMMGALAQRQAAIAAGAETARDGWRWPVLDQIFRPSAARSAGTPTEVPIREPALNEQGRV